MSIKDSPAPVADARSCDGGPFAGFYVGAAVGYFDQETDYALGGPGVTVSSDSNGFSGGLYSGYNIQCGRLVVGYESDWNLADSDSSWLDPDTSCGGSPCNSLSSDVKYYGTSRLRLGLVHRDNILIYATGGLAYAKVEHSFSTPDIAFSASDEDWNWGWTAGGGVELLRDGRWGLRAEALYIDLSEDNRSYVGDPGVCGGLCVANVGYDNEFVVARIGLTYKLGAREEAAAPLK